MKTSIDKITIRVMDLDKMTAFYTEKMGMKIVERTEDSVTLNYPTLKLVKSATQNTRKGYNGMYHMAYLLKDEITLARFWQHLIKENVHVLGHSDHGFSHAIYFNDPEYNGIEVYVDMEPSRWPYEDDLLGFVSSRLEPSEYLDQNVEEFNGLDQSVIWGHIHLSVSDLDRARSFYVDTLHFDVKIETPRTLFVSKDGYHHHIGMNTWATPAGDLPSDHTGLISYHMTLTDTPKQTIKDPFGILVLINEKD